MNVNAPLRVIVAPRTAAGSRSDPWLVKGGIRGPLPYLLEWALLAFRSFLFEPLRSFLRAGAIQRESRSLAHRPRSPQSAKLIARPINPAGASFWYRSSPMA